MIGEKLTSHATLHKGLCVCSGRWPKQTCTEGLAYKGPSCGVVAAESGMNFGQELPPFLFGDASLEHSGHTFLIKLSLVDLAGFRAPHNTMCFHFGPQGVLAYLGRLRRVLSTGQ